MGNCRSRTIMDDIRDLTDKSINHDYDKELAHIERTMHEEKCKMQEEYSIAYRKLENENKCKDCAGCTQWKCDCSNIRNKTIDEFVDNLIRNSRTEIIDGNIRLIVTEKRIKLIAEQMKKGE